MAWMKALDKNVFQKESQWQNWAKNFTANEICPLKLLQFAILILIYNKSLKVNTTSFKGWQDNKYTRHTTMKSFVTRIASFT